ncbi:MAG TPA: UDP-N-acetylmuramoyl-tripeptide--D-alanyl-D-alanine ligase [Candidatus Eisenbacteria bacterium]|jgi:UDP-N-acetylmuramoyl-tripeptide--D-alanyl-D-alanine ligase|nr:UDP-N-acetylmuramoyl-tripeptide--D-alanyl-D-alanine ligase [Candidatus Eisenbacteria bacterium]
MKLPLARIAEFLSASGEFDHNAMAQGYSIDSRTLQPGELFFAVKGERLDGHDFVESALQKGAVAAVVRRDQLARYPVKTRLMAVDDALMALQTLAAAVRRLWAKPLIGVTGSVGKTTTKEAIAHLLSTRFRVLKSEGNFNNHFGLPLMLLKLEPGHEAAVIEFGMSHLGEIATLAKIARPEIGVVTAVAPVHLEFFKSVAEIARAKYELVESLPAGGTAVLNADDEYVSQFGRDFHGKVITFGLRPTADVHAENIQPRGPAGSIFELVVGACREKVTLPLVGTHNVYNALAAVAVALERGLTPSEAVSALATLTPADKRGQVLQLGNITIINDCYNSNPKALDAMVDTLAAMPARRRIVVAGEMLELGPTGEELHRRCGQHIAQKKIDVLVGVRGLAQPMVEAAKAAEMRAEFVATPEEAGDWLAREAREGDVILLKASRGVKLEKALEIVVARLSSVASKTRSTRADD